MKKQQRAATQKVLETLRDMAGKARFISFTYRNKKAGELSRHTLIFGASYRKQVEESLASLELLMPTFVTPLQIQAAQELKDSFNSTLEAISRKEYNPDYTKKDVYVHIAPGIKYNINSGVMNVSGLAHAKLVLEKGVYPIVRHKPLTKAKKAIREKLPVARWREFCVTPNHLEVARLQGDRIVLK